MIRTRFLESFDESLKRLPVKDRARASAALGKLIGYFGGSPRPLGLGLRKLKGPYWEIRAGLDHRVFFSLENDLATFIFIGDHDEIRRLIQRY